MLLNLVAFCTCATYIEVFQKGSRSPYLYSTPPHCAYILAWFYSRERERDKRKERKKEKKEKKKKKGLFIVRERKEKEEKGLFVVLLHCFRWCVVTSFVSRLAPLARSRLGPAQYHR